MATKRRKRRRRPQAPAATPGQRHNELAATFDRWLELNLEVFQVCVHVVEEMRNPKFAEEAAERDAEKQAEILKKQPGELKGWEKALADDFVNDTSTNWNASYLPDIQSPVCNPRFDSPGVVMLDLDKFVTEHDAILRSAAFAVFEREQWSQGEQPMEAAREKNETNRQNADDSHDQISFMCSSGIGASSPCSGGANGSLPVFDCRGDTGRSTASC